ncbi:MAG TPA: thioredoxin family protein [Opitutaceae bacterium]|nr:thioredoxin family protein [Opitutaceae bacterium]
MTSASNPIVASAGQWLAARRELLRKEKEYTRLGDQLAKLRRDLPWVKVEKPFRFDSTLGQVSLADLFDGRSQLIVQHFMFGPGWEEGCKSCSFMMDHFNPTVPHLNARDVSFAAISRAPLAEIIPFKTRMGWNVNWVSAHGTDFNRDFHVSFTEEEIATGKVYYNFGLREFPKEEAPGISVFARDAAGDVYHTYSTYGRGLEVVMATYKLLDLVPKGRDEDGLEYGMEWLRYHDRYDPAAATA